MLDPVAQGDEGSRDALTLVALDLDGAVLERTARAALLFQPFEQCFQRRGILSLAPTC